MGRVVRVADIDDNTAPTEEDGLVDQLRRQGILGPFRISDWAGRSDRGLRREQNEDRLFGDASTGFAVADGMGGHAGGELAAEVAVKVAVERLPGLTEAGARELVDAANVAVVRAGVEHGLDRLGTTLVALVSEPSHVVVLSVGDSRVYRWRDDELEQLTVDHSVRNELLASGVPLESAAAANVRLDALTSFIGQRSEFSPACRVASFSIMTGDRFLLCTDGIHGQLEPGEIGRALASGDCAAAVTALIDGANQAGGRDNATAIVIEFSAREM